MRTRTLRGQLTDTVVKQLVVDDGRLTNGYIVKEFYVWVDGGGTEGVYAVLGKEYDMTSGGDASDSRQIAWAGNAWSTAGQPTATSFNVIDPDHVILKDLYIQRINPADACNYLVVLEPRGLSNDQAILQLIKERSQDDER
tara:strand:- start:434 stop:856 length:423 start_codon:yes stop_codon:yes gene_type:complete